MLNENLKNNIKAKLFIFESLKNIVANTIFFNFQYTIT